jgi:hypothetical protein
MDGVTCPRYGLGESLALEADSLRLLARGSARRVADCFVRALGTSNRILHHGEMGGQEGTVGKGDSHPSRQ